jgi:DNA replicative helicase MCM subunit Mcm2 (Cdc46/Mcm family)
MKKKVFFLIISVKIKTFFEKFIADNHFKYTELINSQPKEIEIDLDDVYSFDQSLCLAIENNCKRFSNLFCQVIDDLTPMFFDVAVR